MLMTDVAYMFSCYGSHVFCSNFPLRPRGGAVSLHSEEAAPTGLLPGQGQRVAAHRARPLSVLHGRRVQGGRVI